MMNKEEFEESGQTEFQTFDNYYDYLVDSQDEYQETSSAHV